MLWSSLRGIHASGPCDDPADSELTQEAGVSAETHQAHRHGRDCESVDETLMVGDSHHGAVRSLGPESGDLILAVKKR